MSHSAFLLFMFTTPGATPCLLLPTLPVCVVCVCVCVCVCLCVCVGGVWQRESEGRSLSVCIHKYTRIMLYWGLACQPGVEEGGGGVV